MYPGSTGVYYARALRELGNEVFSFDYKKAISGKKYFLFRKRTIARKMFDRLFKPVERMNHTIVNIAQDIQPDLIIFIKGDLIFQRTIQTLTDDMGYKTVLWYQDGSTLLETRPSNKDILPAMKYYSISFFGDLQGISAAARKSIKRIEFLTFGCDPTVHRTWKLTESERSHFGSDVCFVGNPGIDSQRKDILFNLKEFNLKIWGWGWQKADIPDSPNLKFMGPAYGDDLAKAYSASKIAININAWECPNFRNFEAPACGVLVITSPIPDLDHYFRIGKEIITFDGLKDLQEKINYFLTHENERSEIAKAGQLRAHRDHTNRQRMEQLLSICSKT